MKIQIEVDEEVVDNILKTELKWHVAAIKDEIKKFKKIKNPAKFQIEEYNYNQRLSFALKVVGEYFGIKHHEK